MIDALRKLSLRQRVALAVWAVNICLCAVLLGFVLR